GTDGWYLFVQPSTHAVALCINGGTIQDNATANFYDGSWHNLIVAYDSSVGTTGYLDGTPLTFSAGNLMPSTSSASFMIGLSGQHTFDGQFYDIRFYNVTLSSTDATSIVAGGS